MRRLDIIVLGLCLLGIIFILGEESSLKFSKSFQIPFDSSLSPLFFQISVEDTPHLLLYTDMAVNNEGCYVKITKLDSLHQYQLVYWEEEFSTSLRYYIEERICNSDLLRQESIVTVSYDTGRNQFFFLLSNGVLLQYEFSLDFSTIFLKQQINSMYDLLKAHEEMDYNDKDGHHKSHMKVINGRLEVIEEVKIHSNDDGVMFVVIETEDKHYNYFGFDLKSLELRYSHTQHDYHFNEEKMDGNANKFSFTKDLEHYGEIDHKIFKLDMLRQLPHIYRDKYDLKATVDSFKPYRKGEDDKGEPNVMVVHHSKGIEIIHLYTGRTLTQLNPLNHDILYDDFNHDGIIESAGVKWHDNDDCVVEIETGIPSNPQNLADFENLKISVCKKKGLFSYFSLDFLETEYQIIRFKPLSPTYIKNKQFTDIVFLNNNGLVTAIRELDKELLKIKWQTETHSQFQDKENKFYEISSFNLRESDEKVQFLVASGEKVLTVLDNNGKIQQSIHLPSPPIRSIVFSDINGDKLTDLIITTESSIFGYVAKTSFSRNNVLTFMICAFILVIFVMYLTTLIDVKDPLYRKKVMKSS